MKEVIVHPLPELHTEIHEVPIPIPGTDEAVIKAAVAGSNVKDWAHLTSLSLSMNSGDDIAGTIHALGSTVSDFHVGQRVAAFHRMLAPHGAYAEYAVAPAHTVFHIPDSTSFEEAATLPLITLNASVSLFRRQTLPPPWSPLLPNSTSLPLIIYGASSSLGAFAIKLALKSNIHPIIAICGSSRAYISTLLSPEKGDAIIDYCQGPEIMKRDVRAALGEENSKRARHALDAISSKGSWVPLAQLVGQPGGDGGVVSVVSGANRYNEPEIPSSVQIVYTYVGTAHEGAYKPKMPKQPAAGPEDVKADIDFAFLMCRYLGRMLARGEFEGHPVRVVPGGLGGVEEGLRALKGGKAEGRKFVYRIGEVEGVAR